MVSDKGFTINEESMLAVVDEQHLQAIPHGEVKPTDLIKVSRKDQWFYVYIGQVEPEFYARGLRYQDKTTEIRPITIPFRGSVTWKLEKVDHIVAEQLIKHYHKVTQVQMREMLDGMQKLRGKENDKTRI